MSWLTPEQAAKHEITPAELVEFGAFRAEDSSNPPERKEHSTMTHQYAVDEAIYGRTQPDQATGLPCYVGRPGPVLIRLRDTDKRLSSTAARLNTALAEALAAFEAGFAAEDRVAQTQARLDALTTRGTRR